jgi:hypothetical protein
MSRVATIQLLYVSDFSRARAEYQAEQAWYDSHPLEIRYKSSGLPGGPAGGDRGPKSSFDGTRPPTPGGSLASQITDSRAPAGNIVNNFYGASGGSLAPGLTNLTGAVPPQSSPSPSPRVGGSSVQGVVGENPAEVAGWAVAMAGERARQLSEMKRRTGLLERSATADTVTAAVSDIAVRQVSAIGRQLGINTLSIPSAGSQVTPTPQLLSAAAGASASPYALPEPPAAPAISARQTIGQEIARAANAIGGGGGGIVRAAGTPPPANPERGIVPYVAPRPAIAPAASPAASPAGGSTTPRISIPSARSTPPAAAGGAGGGGITPPATPSIAPGSSPGSGVGARGGGASGYVSPGRPGTSYVSVGPNTYGGGFNGVSPPSRGPADFIGPPEANFTQRIDAGLGGLLDRGARLHLLPRFLPRAYRAAGGIEGLTDVGIAAGVVQSAANVYRAGQVYQNADALNVSGNRDTAVENDLTYANSVGTGFFGRIAGTLVDPTGSRQLQTRQTLAEAHQQDQNTAVNQGNLVASNALRGAVLDSSTDPRVRLQGRQLAFDTARTQRNSTYGQQRQDRADQAAQLDRQADDKEVGKGGFFSDLLDYATGEDIATADLRSRATNMRAANNGYFSRQQKADDANATALKTSQDATDNRNLNASRSEISDAGAEAALAVTDSRGAQRRSIESSYQRRIDQAGDDKDTVNTLSTARDQQLKAFDISTQRSNAALVAQVGIGAIQLQARQLGNQGYGFQSAMAGIEASRQIAAQTLTQNTQGVTDPTVLKAEMEKFRQAIAGLASDAVAVQRQFNSQTQSITAGTGVIRQSVLGNNFAAATANTNEKYRQAILADPAHAKELADQQDAENQGNKVNDLLTHLGVGFGIAQRVSNTRSLALRGDKQYQTADVNDEIANDQLSIASFNITHRGAEFATERRQNTASIIAQQRQSAQNLFKENSRPGRGEEVSAYVGFGDATDFSEDDRTKAMQLAAKGTTAITAADKATNEDAQSGSYSSKGATAQQAQQAIDFLTQMLNQLTQFNEG